MFSRSKTWSIIIFLEMNNDFHFPTLSRILCGTDALFSKALHATCSCTDLWEMENLTFDKFRLLFQGPPTVLITSGSTACFYMISAACSDKLLACCHEKSTYLQDLWICLKHLKEKLSSHKKFHFLGTKNTGNVNVFMLKRNIGKKVLQTMTHASEISNVSTKD